VMVLAPALSHRTRKNGAPQVKFIGRSKARVTRLTNTVTQILSTMFFMDSLGGDS
jgi:hypothetical protein